MKFKCPHCDEEHEGYPALAFSTPHYYNTLSLEDKQTLAEINSDFCIINHGDQVDRFVRCVLIQKINGVCQNLEYGVWISLSQESFKDYQDHFHLEDYEATYFGWLSNRIPEYQDTLSVRTFIKTRGDGQRPIVLVQEKNDFNNPFVKDYFEGISEEEALRRVAMLMRHSRR